METIKKFIKIFMNFYFKFSYNFWIKKIIKIKTIFNIYNKE
ncbi:hypothetical protein CPC_1910 [Clostridium perfringens C str. JGS1495]|nr:hypothetical protein FORC25_2025 [Clostridium perfringens]EDS81302.1 hypothetical protein CPC_1910 [Clostridium perfringens C str. JGS1495]